VAVSKRVLQIVQLLAFAAAAVVSVYAIGWLITWARLAAARLPIDSSLPMIDDKVVFVAGLRLVFAMVIVFGVMCALAYFVHLWTWEAHAQEWHSIVGQGRRAARQNNPRPHAARLTRPKLGLASLKPQSAPADLNEAKIGEPIVRVIAGFNVWVIAAALGLAGARVVKTLIDQIDPGQWWALLGPWALFSVIGALLLARVNPLRGNSLVHGLVWAAVAAVALVSSAPIGLLFLTWAGIATLGRRFGRTYKIPESRLQLVLSPLPWVLLTIYALVGLAYHAMPPVSFSQTVIMTSDGMRLGGYLAQTGAGIYLVSCTPLADATSINESVSLIPSREVASVAYRDGQFTLDSGYRPSLPTLALHALGIDEQTPTWIRPELKAKKATCAGSQPPRPSGATEAPQLGSGVFAGPAPRGGQAHDREAPIEQTTPGIARLARRFQPTILVTVADRFWPVSVGALLEDLGSDGTHTCKHPTTRDCRREAPQFGDLKEQGSAEDFLQFPAIPALAEDPTGQFDAFARGQLGVGAPVPSLHTWLSDPGVLSPWSTGQIYFYDAGDATRLKWPAASKDISPGLIALEYWFFYPYNYFPTVATPDLMNDAPIAADVVNTDLHQGDWEHIAVLVETKTLTPRWLYMARHTDEGEYVPWNSPLLTFDEGHPVVQAAIGGHSTYDPHCGARRRFAHGLKGLASDWVVCGSGRLAFRAASTPLVDIAKAPWACWRGHFGVATPSEVAGAKLNEGAIQLAIDRYYHVAGPRSPLWQGENGHLIEDGTPLADSGPCVSPGGPSAAEHASFKEGIGGGAPAPPRPAARQRR
jgi:hypothetical protein